MFKIPFVCIKVIVYKSHLTYTVQYNVYVLQVHMSRLTYTIHYNVYVHQVHMSHIADPVQSR